MQPRERRADGSPLRRDFVRVLAVLAVVGTLRGARGATTAVRRSGDSAGIHAITERFAACFLRGANAAVPESVGDLVSRLRGDGSWADLDESAPLVRGQIYFRPFPHVHRLRKIAGAFRTEQSAERRRALADALRRGLGWWLQHKPAARAAWYQEIGAPTQLGQMYVLAEEAFTPAERAGVVASLETAAQPDGSLIYSGRPATGQNLIWEAQLQILAGGLTEDAGKIERYARRAEQEMQLTRREGLQPDYSFHQHGPQLYSGGYGQDFAEDCARLIRVLDGTRHAFGADTCGHLLRYLLDGQQWMIRGRHWDFGVIGRWVAWPEGTHVASGWRTGFPGATGLAHACRDLEEFAGGRRAELKAFAARLEGRARPDAGAPEGCRVFWRSEYVAFAQREFHFGVRMTSRRVNGTETSTTGQGLLNWHLGDGATCLLRTGTEYADIAPVWNWRRLPGVTCVQTPDQPLPRNVWGKGSDGGSDFAGGVTDGENGLAAMELARGGAKARKAWFLTRRGIVCLGAGVRAEAAGVPLVTGVEQCWNRSPVLTSGAAEVALKPGVTTTLRGESWAWHDGVAYLFGPGSDVRARAERRQGHWSVVNTFIHAPDEVSGPVVELWLEHAAGRVSHYHYVIVPGLEPADIAGYRARTEPRVLGNTEEVQAVATEAQWFAVFWQPGEIALGEAGRLTVDTPCLVQLRRTGGTWRAAVGNPTQVERTIRIVLEATTAPRHRWIGDFDFRSPERAGAPQVSELRRT